jgi:hypothetical protein
MTSFQIPRTSFAKAPKLKGNISTLVQMHTYMRPAGSSAEAAFCKRYLDNLPGMTIDKANNRILRIGGDEVRVLWSSHTDTVHLKSGMQKLMYGGGFLSLHTDSLGTANCLGADCTVGVWLMREMILLGIPGLYVFHAGEECGGKGSNYIAAHTPELLKGIDYAIAFDRKGTSSVISHQMSRCASDKFVDALCYQLGSNFNPDDTGTFTDTANYTDIVPECTNISVGYYSQHTSSEVLDVSFAAHLLDVIHNNLDVASLPVMRDPTVVDKSDWGYGGWYGDHYGMGKGFTIHKGGKYAVVPPKKTSKLRTVEDWVKEWPEVAALVLEEAGFDLDALEDVVDEYYGPVGDR